MMRVYAIKAKRTHLIVMQPMPIKCQIQMTDSYYVRFVRCI